MLKMARTQVSSCKNPRLVFIYQNDKGVLTDVSALAYEIYDVSTLAKQLNPVEVVAKADVPVIACTLPDGGKLSTGRYVAGYTIPADWDLGEYVLRWYYTVDGTEYTIDEKLLITDEDHGSPDYYITIQDAYDSGIPDTYTPAQVQTAIKAAQAFITRTTRRVFVPQYKALKVDGRGGPKLLLMEPIIAVESLMVNYEYFDFSLEEAYFYEDFKVYNRHIREGLIAPDDRNNPKIEFSYGSRPFGAFLRMPDGSQDISVVGVFGYTEPDGTPMGSTPADIVYVTKLLTNWYIVGPNTQEADDIKAAGKLISERTRDQSWTFASPTQIKGQTGQMGSAGYFTGDPTIDGILYAYKAPAFHTGA